MAADIRPARADDVLVLEQIENASFDADRISKRSFARLIASRSAAVLVANDGGGVDGYCVVLFRTGSASARLYSIAVRPGTGKAGLGSALLDAAEQAAAARGCATLRLEVRRDNARAIRLYERNGFSVTGSSSGYYADGEDALRYEKPLGGGEAARAAGRKGSRP